jgi:hypothetical protein
MSAVLPPTSGIEPSVRFSSTTESSQTGKSASRSTLSMPSVVSRMYSLISRCFSRLFFGSLVLPMRRNRMMPT